MVSRSLASSYSSGAPHEGHCSVFIIRCSFVLESLVGVGRAPSRRGGRDYKRICPRPELQRRAAVVYISRISFHRSDYEEMAVMSGRTRRVVVYTAALLLAPLPVMPYAKGTREFAAAVAVCGAALSLASLYVARGELSLKHRGL